MGKLQMRPLNDWWRRESVYDLRGELRSKVTIDGQDYAVPETSDEVRYRIEDVSLDVENRGVVIWFKDHVNWKGPIYLLLYRRGQSRPLRVMSVMPDNYYSTVQVDLPEDVDPTSDSLLAVLTSVKPKSVDKAEQMALRQAGGATVHDGDGHADDSDAQSLANDSDGQGQTSTDAADDGDAQSLADGGDGQELADDDEVWEYMFDEDKEPVNPAPWTDLGGARWMKSLN